LLLEEELLDDELDEELLEELPEDPLDVLAVPADAPVVPLLP